MKKMMFNDKFGLTDAVLNGSKTQTRRMIPSSVFDKWMDYDEYCDTVGGRMSRQNIHEFLLMHSKHLVGDIIAVAQSYKDSIYPEKVDCSSYSSTIDGKDVYFGWNDAGYANKMFVKADLMPHQIRITGVRVEKLQDISDEDCMKEGVRKGDFSNTWDKYYITIGSEYNKTFKTPKDAYFYLIDKISGKGTWENNPFVWVYDFELVK